MMFIHVCLTRSDIPSGLLVSLDQFVALAQKVMDKLKLHNTQLLLICIVVATLVLPKINSNETGDMCKKTKEVILVVKICGSRFLTWDWRSRPPSHAEDYVPNVTW